MRCFSTETRMSGGEAAAGVPELRCFSTESSMSGGEAAGGDDDLDRSLRPRALGDFVNQEQVTGQLEVFIEAAKRRGEPLDHVLLAGPPGLGKTSLANIVAAELEVPLVQTAGPALERK